MHAIRSEVSGEVNRFQFSNSDHSSGNNPFQNVLNPIGVVGGLGLFPNVPYRPVQGLVALFGRASSSLGYPRAPLINPRTTFGFLYAAAIM
jgi:hypothetical protein